MTSGSRRRRPCAWRRPGERAAPTTATPLQRASSCRRTSTVSGPMISPRVAYFLAIVAGVGMTALAAWVIIESPGEIDDVGANRTPAPSGSPVQVTVGEGEGPAAIGDRLE